MIVQLSLTVDGRGLSGLSSSKQIGNHHYFENNQYALEVRTRFIFISINWKSEMWRPGPPVLLANSKSLDKT